MILAHCARTVANRTLQALTVLFVVGCTYTGADHPVATKFSWFSYLNGDDMRPRCRPGGPDHYRLVYNAVYQEQVRTYEIETGPAGASLLARIHTEADLTEWTIDPAAPDAFGPWRPKTSRTQLRPRDLAAFVAALEKDGVLAPPPVGLELPSEGFYWLIAACTQGTFRVTAFLWPDGAFKRLTFDELLFAWDFTDVPVSPPRHASNLELYGETQPSEPVTSFQVRIGKDGLWGISRPF